MGVDVRVGFEWIEGTAAVRVPLNINAEKKCHWIITGGSGSGKTYLLLYALNSVLNVSIRLFIADFKGSGDFCRIVSDYAEFGACMGLVEAFYAEYRKIKENRTGERILLIFDEYPGFLIWLEGQDKKKAAEIKNMVAEILMMGRSLPGGGSAWFWCVCQRADSTYFSHGARENYMVSVGMGRISKESKGMLFPGEEFPENYYPRTGQGVILEDGHPLRVFQVPEFDKNRLIAHLMKKGVRQGVDPA